MTGLMILVGSAKYSSRSVVRKSRSIIEKDLGQLFDTKKSGQFVSSHQPNSLSRCYVSRGLDPTTSPKVIFQAQNAAFFPFGTPSNDPSQAIFTDLSWTIREGDCWAVWSNTKTKSDGSKSSKLDSTGGVKLEPMELRQALVDVLRSRTRSHPPQAVSHPILKTLEPIHRSKAEGGPRLPSVDDIIKVVKFSTRLNGGGGNSGFSDYTSRYYSIRDEDKLTLREHLRQSIPYEENIDIMNDHSRKENDKCDSLITETATMLEVDRLLDLPLITLSNGQTRRARIVKALLSKPELLILEEPFTGLDTSSRQLLSLLLTRLHQSRKPRILLLLRPQDPLPEFVTHLALVGGENDENGRNSQIIFGKKEAILDSAVAKDLTLEGERKREAALARRSSIANGEAEGSKSDEDKKKVLVQLRDVNVSYGPRVVLNQINWTIREGDRWILSGHNGSGKSTLLSLVLGDHPRSFSEDIELFGKPRDRQATATIRQNIGHVSPEIFNAFPRRYGEAGLTVKEAIVTGFESIYCYRQISPSQQVALNDLIHRFDYPTLLTSSFLSKSFVELSPGEQSLVLLLRALVKNSALLVLDEPFSGMDKTMIEKVHQFLNRKLDPKQALVIISHFEEEVPDTFTKSIKLDSGIIVEEVASI